VQFAFTNRQSVLLQAVCRMFYKRTASWINTVIVTTFRLSQILCINEKSKENFEFPTEAKIYNDLKNGKLHTLAGFMTDNNMK